MNLFGGHRPTFGFVVLLFVGVVLFCHLLELCYSLVQPIDGVGSGNTFGGGGLLNSSSPVPYAIPLFFFFCWFFLEWLQVPLIMLHLSSPIFFFSCFPFLLWFFFELIVISEMQRAVLLIVTF